MSAKPTEVIACPVCSSEVTLEQLVGHLEGDRTFARLIALSVPLPHLVMQYVSLFTPAKQRLTTRKKLRLVEQLLPDLQRQAVTHKGRDWPAPLVAWEQAIEQMLAARIAGRLELPMSGHGYLYSILAGLGEKVAAAAEQQQEQDRRISPRRDTVQVRGQTLPIGEALQVTFAGKDPALAAIEASNRNAAPMPADVRDRIAALTGKTPKKDPQ